MALRNLSPLPRRAETGSTGKVKGGFLLWLSGADLPTLEKCPRERGKFTGVGGVVLTTAVMAAASCMFALIIGARAPIAIAIPVGLLWGLAIMNLDRWLVTATVRRDRWFQNLFVALPRLFLALIIGVVISTPLVLWIFQHEINTELNVMQQEKRGAFQKSLDEDPEFKKIPELTVAVAKLQSTVDGTNADLLQPTAEIVTLRQRVAEQTTDYNTKLLAATKEFDGTAGTGNVGDGPAYRLKKRIADAAERTLRATEKQLKTAEDKAAKEQVATIANARASAQAQLDIDRPALQRLVDTKRAKEDQFNADNGKDTGLLARLDALSHFTDRNSTLRTAYLALLAFITAIEILPVLVKFLMSLGPPTLYDQILATGDKSSLVTANAAYEYEQKIAARELEERLAKEDAAVPGLVDRMVAAEVEVYDHKIGEWRDGELGRTAPAPPPPRRSGRAAGGGTRHQTPPPPPPRGKRPAQGGGQPAWPTPGEGATSGTEDRAWGYDR